MSNASPCNRQIVWGNALAICLCIEALLTLPATAESPLPVSSPIEVSAAVQRLDMAVNTSRMLTLDHVFPRAQVTNPEVLEIHPVSPIQMQVFAKKTGVTQINLYDQKNRVRTLDVFVNANIEELDSLLKAQFPDAALQIVPLANSVILGGFVNRADDVNRIIRIAEDYCPKVITNISVGGTQQVLLHVRVMEVSRTKLREHGFDFRCGIVKDNKRFLGFLGALQQNNLIKILAEPTLVASSGRSASFRAGGEFPVIVPGALGTNSIEYKTYGMEIDFVPIVLDSGRIRLEVRPRVSELDAAQTTTLGKNTVPSLRVRQVDTGVEMRAGQTLALAGLIQNRIEAERRGIPLLADIPYFGAIFRHVSEKNNEIELLIMVTPEIVESLEPHQVPPVGPGMNSISPKSKALYRKGHIEAPNPYMPPTGYAVPNGAYDAFVPEMYEEVIPQAVLEPNTAAERIPYGLKSAPLTGILPKTNQPGLAVPVGFESYETSISSTAQQSRRAIRVPPVLPPSQANRRAIPAPLSKASGKDREAPGLIGPLGYDLPE